MHKKSIITLLICLVFIAQVWFIYITFSYPYTGVILDKTEQNEWVIERFESESVDVGLKVGDIILEVDHKNVNKHASIYKFHGLEQFKQVLVLRDGEKVEVLNHTFPSVTTYDILPLFSLLLSFLLIFLLYKYSSHHESAKHLSYLHVVIAMAFISTGASSRGEVLGLIFIYTLVMFLPILFLNFLYVFLKEKADVIISIRFTKLLTILILFTILPQLFFFTDSSAIYFIYDIIGFLVICYLLFGLLSIFLILTKLYFSYRKEKSYASTLIKSIWVSLFLSFAPLSIFSYLPFIITGNAIMEPIYTTWFILFFPFSFSYLIITKQIYDLNVITRRILFIICFSLLPSAFIITMIMYLFKPDLSSKQLTLALITTSFILFLTLALTRYITNKFEKWIYPKKHNLKMKLNLIVEKLGTITNFHEFKSIILPDIIQLYKVHGAAIILIYKNNYESISKGTIDVEEIKNLLKTPKNLDEHPFYTSYEINRHKEYTSYLVLTKKTNNTVLGLEEKQWLFLICSYLKICLENIYYLRKLRFELQEKERFRIATDLHDSTMQDLFFLKRRLGAVAGNKSITKEEKKEITNLLDYIDIINLSLRQGCFELYPYTIQDMGLNHAIHKLIDQLQLIHDLEINFLEINEIENYSMEEKRQLFRIIQELLNNTIKHAQANTVNITFKTKETMFRLIYEDNGIGLDVKKKAKHSTKRSESGLDHIRYRVIDLNGKLKIKSNVDKGVQIHMTFPIEEEQKWGLSS
ncbi:ATP-binding protein [Chengkuizengella sp. SCS-71B]|uniref:ATP-binding protein n=1 Tax=Chengkuizengella sp. SCS-71B TaxID=3115290 RepID=UPI0032C2284F